MRTQLWILTFTFLLGPCFALSDLEDATVLMNNPQLKGTTSIVERPTAGGEATNAEDARKKHWQDAFQAMTDTQSSSGETSTEEDPDEALSKQYSEFMKAKEEDPAAEEGESGLEDFLSEMEKKGDDLTDEQKKLLSMMKGQEQLNEQLKEKGVSELHEKMMKGEELTLEEKEKLESAMKEIQEGAVNVADDEETNEKKKQLLAAVKSASAYARKNGGFIGTGEGADALATDQDIANFAKYAVGYNADGTTSNFEVKEDTKTGIYNVVVPNEKGENRTFAHSYQKDKLPEGLKVEKNADITISGPGLPSQSFKSVTINGEVYVDAGDKGYVHYKFADFVGDGGPAKNSTPEQFLVADVSKFKPEGAIAVHPDMLSNAMDRSRNIASMFVAGQTPDAVQWKTDEKGKPELPFLMDTSQGPALAVHGDVGPQIVFGFEKDGDALVPVTDCINCNPEAYVGLNQFPEVGKSPNLFPMDHSGSSLAQAASQHAKRLPTIGVANVGRTIATETPQSSASSTLINSVASNQTPMQNIPNQSQPQSQGSWQQVWCSKCNNGRGGYIWRKM